MNIKEEEARPDDNPPVRYTYTPNSLYHVTYANGEDQTLVCLILAPSWFQANQLALTNAPKGWRHTWTEFIEEQGKMKPGVLYQIEVI